MDEYLKKNGFGSLDKYNEYVHETSRMDEASKDLGKKIKSEQTTFDAVYFYGGGYHDLWLLRRIYHR